MGVRKEAGPAPLSVPWLIVALLLGVLSGQCTAVSIYAAGWLDEQQQTNPEADGPPH